MKITKTILEGARSISCGKQVVAKKIPEGHVRVKLAAASLCGTDLHYYQHFSNAGFQLQNPVTLGHEACGYVAEANGSALKEGDLVALNPIMNCGACTACARGEVNLCANKKFPGSATTHPHLDGFFRDVIDHPAAQCRLSAPGTNPRHLTFAEPLACALHALNKAGVKKGEKLLVTGCGPMGLLTIAGAVSRGAHVCALDLRAPAARLAQKLGAKEGLIAGEFDASQIEKSFDVVIEASGSTRALNIGLRSLRPKGRLSILSNIQLQQAELMLHLIMLGELTITGSFQFHQEFEEAARLVEEGAISFDALTCAVYPLEKLGDALEFMASGQAIGKIVISGDYGKAE